MPMGESPPPAEKPGDEETRRHIDQDKDDQEAEKNAADPDQTPNVDEVLEGCDGRNSASPQPDLFSALPIQYIIRSCDLQSTRIRLFRELCFYLPFLILFCCYVLVGQQTNEWYFMNAQVGGQLREGQLGLKESLWTDAAGPNYHSFRDFSSLNSLEEWYNWVESVALPLIWDAGIDSNQNRSAFAFGGRTIIGNNNPLGAVRFRTIRVRATNRRKEGGCQLNEEILHAEDVGFVQPSTRLGPGTCYPGFQLRHESSIVNNSEIVSVPFSPAVTSGFTTDDDCGRGAAAATFIGYFESYPPCAGNTLDIPLNVSLVEAVDRTKSMRAWLSNETSPTDYQSTAFGEMIGFVDPRLINTRLLTLEFFYFSPVYETFTSTQATLEVSVSGHLNTVVTSRNFLIWTTERTGETVYFVFFMIVVGIYTMMVPFHQVQRIRARGGSLLSLFSDAWFFVDIVNVAMFAAGFLCRIVWMSWSSGCTLLSKTQRETSFHYPEELEGIAILYLLMNYFNITNVVLSFLKLIKFTELNYSMSVVLKTLAVAKSDIFGVMVVFAAVVVSYTFAGIIFFGAALPHRFSTFWRAFSSLLRMLIGDFEFESMAKVNRNVAGLYFWTFMILALFLMLSFLVGVLDSVFEDVGSRINAKRRRTAKNPSEKKLSVGKRIRNVFRALKDFASAPWTGIKKLFSRFRRWLSIPDQLGLLAVGMQRHLDDLTEQLRLRRQEPLDGAPQSPISETFVPWSMSTSTRPILDDDNLSDDDDRRTTDSDNKDGALEQTLIPFGEVYSLLQKHLGASTTKRIDFRVVNRFWRVAIANRSHDDTTVEDVEGEALKAELSDAVDEAIDYLFGLKGGAQQIEGLLGEHHGGDGYEEADRERARLVHDVLLNEEMCAARLQQLSERLSLLEEAFCWRVLSQQKSKQKTDSH
jgi:hypothetical protein